MIVAAAGSGFAAWSSGGGWAPLLIASALPLAVVGLLDDRLNLGSSSYCDDNFFNYGEKKLLELLFTLPQFHIWYERNYSSS